jgi:hypothetical protein
VQRFNSEELDILSELQESVSAICCTAAYVLQAEEVWPKFHTWLVSQVGKGDPEMSMLLSSEITHENMHSSLMQTDRLLMLAEGIQAFGDPKSDFETWFADDEGTAPDG